jgi:predicted nucleotidyltransferase
MFVKMSENTVKRVNVVDEKWQGNGHVARPNAEFVNNVMESAMAFTVKRSSESEDVITKKIKSNDEWMNSTYRYALGKAIADSLRTNPEFNNLYLFGSVVSDSARLTSDINMLLHVDADKEDFEAWVALLDEELTKNFKEKFNAGSGFLTLVNCHVITNDDVNKRAGYASMLSSTHSSLICL